MLKTIIDVNKKKISDKQYLSLMNLFECNLIIYKLCIS